MIKLDFHTHSSASPDGGIRAEQYRELLEQGVVDIIAVTDHNSTKVARELHSSLGDRIIIGEEIMSSQGELIGLYLHTTIKPGMTAKKTAEAIHAQGGIVYIPHPFETVRHALPEDVLNEIANLIDIVEVVNGRALLQNKGPRALTWATLHHKRTAASSDAHTHKGVGASYTVVKNLPVKESLLVELESAELKAQMPPYYTLLAPKYNRIRNKLGFAR